MPSSSLDDSSFEGLGSLVRLSGANVPARARYVGETLLAATFSSLTVGLVCGQVGSITPFGPLVPFLIGSWTGYSFGLWNQWRTSRSMVLDYAKKYPALMHHSLSQERHLQIAADTPRESEDLVNWILQGGVGRMTICILAAANCRSAVEELVDRQRQKLVDEHDDE